jgi:hypothetical protein
LKNGETVGLVNLASIGAVGTAGVVGGPYPITIGNARGGTFNPNNYAISLTNGSLAVTPATLIVTPNNQRKPVGDTFVFDNTKFAASGLKNGETIGFVILSSNGARSSALTGNYAITAANAGGGTFDAANYMVVYLNGTLVVFAKPPPEEPPPFPPRKDIQDLISMVDQTSNPQSASDQSSDEGSVITGLGIQRTGLNSLFGEEILEPGGAILIGSSGLGPLLPIGEAPENLEEQLAEKPQEALEEAIAEDDRKRGVRGRTRYYKVSPGEVLEADALGGAGFEQLGKAPAVLLRATGENTERNLLRAASGE